MGLPAVTLVLVQLACVSPAHNLGRGDRVTQAGVATAPQRPPMALSDESNAAQLQLAREQGQATEPAVAALLASSRPSGRMYAGEYEVAYVLQRPRGAWMPGAGSLRWEEPTGDAYLAVVVRDGGTAITVPGLTVTALLTADDGTTRRVELPFRWDEAVDQYGANLAVTPGRYSLRVEIGSPGFRRHDPVNGHRYVETTFAEFRAVEVQPSGLGGPDEVQQAVRLGRLQGAALRRTFEEMGNSTANDGAQTTVGDYHVAYAIEFAETYWVGSGDELHYFVRPEQSAETNAHIEVAVMDAATGRFLPGLTVHATLRDGEGREVSSGPIPFMWHPWIYHYGENVRVPRSGRYTLAVHVEAAPWPRLGHDTGQRFAAPIDVEFHGVKIVTGQK